MDPATAPTSSPTPLVASNTAAPGPTDHRPTEKWRDFIAPWPTNGPMPASTGTTQNAATNSRPGCTPTITTAATPHSAANHPPAAYLTSQVSTASPANWGDVTVKQAGTGTAAPLARGRALGGSSAINAMGFVRGHRSSYDAWVAA